MKTLSFEGKTLLEAEDKAAEFVARRRGAKRAEDIRDLARRKGYRTMTSEYLSNGTCVIKFTGYDLSMGKQYQLTPFNTIGFTMAEAEDKARAVLSVLKDRA